MPWSVRARSRTIAILVLLFSLASGAPAQAQSAEGTTTTAPKDAKQQYLDAKTELRRLEEASTKLAAEYQEFLAELDEIDARVADLESDIETIERYMAEDEAELREIAVATYKYGALPVRRLDAAIGTQSINEFTLASRYLDHVQSANLGAAKSLRESNQALTVSKAKYERARDEQGRMKEEMRRRRENIELLIDRQEQLVEELRGKIPPEQLAELTSATGGKMKIPEELLAYGNGRIPEGVLEPIGIGRHRLWGPAAQAFRRMYVDALLQGVVIGVTDSYRSYEAQVDVARRKGLYKYGGLAATPGRSNHGWGLALDLDLDYEAQQWMRKNAGAYGFVEDTPREPWHWGYYGHVQQP